MRAGKLRHLLELQRLNETRDGYGGTVRQWATVARIRAAVEPLTGRELWIAQQAESQTTHKITIRYRKGITSKDRLLFGTRVFQIDDVLTPEEIRHEQVIMARETPNSG